MIIAQRWIQTFTARITAYADSIERPTIHGMILAGDVGEQSGVEANPVGLGDEGMPRNRLILLVLTGVALVAMLVLASSLSSLELLPGTPLNIGSQPGQPGTSNSAAAVDQFYPVMRTIVWAAIIFLPLIVYLLIFSPRFRKFFLRSLPLIASLVMAVFIFRQVLQKPGQIANPIAGMNTPQANTVIETDAQLKYIPNPSAWMVTLAGLVIAVVVTALLGWLMWYLLHRPAPPVNVLEELSTGARQALDDLYAGADIKDVIIRCYHEMSRVIQEEKGIRRNLSMTPEEFEVRLVDIGLPPEPVHLLTQVFEEVRYGKRTPGEREERQAILSLNAIVDACRSKT